MEIDCFSALRLLEMALFRICKPVLVVLCKILPSSKREFTFEQPNLLPRSGTEDMFAPFKNQGFFLSLETCRVGPVSKGLDNGAWV